MTIHYTSICHSQRSPNWYRYDDDKVTYEQFVKKQPKDEVLKRLTRTATILFYESEDIIDLQNKDTDRSSSESRFSAS
jgi:hypothetical protein